MRSADSETDHLMVRAEIKFSFCRKFRFCGVKAPKRIYVSKLKDPVVRISLKYANQQVDFSDSDWERVRDNIYEKGFELLGLRIPRHRYWFPDYASNNNLLIVKKRKDHLKFINSSSANTSAFDANLSFMKCKVQCCVHKVKNK